jgi:hypothetical protein
MSGSRPSGSMNGKVKQGKRSPSGTQPLEPTPNSKLTSVPLVRALLVGATGFKPVTSSVSAKHGEPLC